MLNDGRGGGCGSWEEEHTRPRAETYKGTASNHWCVGKGRPGRRESSPVIALACESTTTGCQGKSVPQHVGNLSARWCGVCCKRCSSVVFALFRIFQFWASPLSRGNMLCNGEIVPSAVCIASSMVDGVYTKCLGEDGWGGQQKKGGALTTSKLMGISHCAALIIFLSPQNNMIHLQKPTLILSREHRK